MNFHNQRVLVCGLGRSGRAAALLLARQGALVTVQDIQESSKFNEEAAELQELKELGVHLFLGKSPDDIVKEQDLIVVSPGIPTDLPFMLKARALGVPLWGEIELAYRLCPCPIMAVTGTNGKTTTTALAGEIMKTCYAPDDHRVAVLGNIGLPFTYALPVLGKDSFVVAEISSFQLETTLTFRPHISAVLNITPDHLNRHKTMEIYQSVKEKIFENQNAGDFTILNYDDECCRDMATRTKARVVYFSRLYELAQGVFLKNGSLWARLGSIDEELIERRELPILGNHNVENALAASAMCLCVGASPNHVRKTLYEFQAVEHRIEFVRTFHDVAYYNDSKGTNTDAAIKSIEAMGRPVVLIGGGYDKDVDFSDWVKLFADKVRRLIVMGETADKIIQTCKAYNFNRYDKVNSLKDAVTLAYSAALPGDCVLLSPACASWDMFDNYEQRGKLFKKFVMELE